jgi:hypothetical protein
MTRAAIPLRRRNATGGAGRPRAPKVVSLPGIGALASFGALMHDVFTTPELFFAMGDIPLLI